MLEDTTIHNAIYDKALSSYFRSSGNLLEEESAVLDVYKRQGYRR